MGALASRDSLGKEKHWMLLTRLNLLASDQGVARDDLPLRREQW
jgi:hypothetical protein